MLRTLRRIALLTVAGAIALVGTAVALSYRTGTYSVGNTKAAIANPLGSSGPALQMSIRHGSLSVRVIRFPEHCSYGSRRISDYFTFLSGTQASLTGRVSAGGTLSGSYAASGATDTVSGHVRGGQATVNGAEQGPYNPASTVTPNSCHGTYTFHATLRAG